MIINTHANGNKSKQPNDPLMTGGSGVVSPSMSGMDGKMVEPLLELSDSVTGSDVTVSSISGMMGCTSEKHPSRVEHVPSPPAATVHSGKLQKQLIRGNWMMAGFSVVGFTGVVISAHKTPSSLLGII